MWVKVLNVVPYRRFIAGIDCAIKLATSGLFSSCFSAMETKGK